MKTWPENTAIATRGVLAGAYRGNQEMRQCITHAVVVDAEGWESEEKTLCGKILVDRLADRYGLDSEVEKPSCNACLKKLS